MAVNGTALKRGLLGSLKHVRAYSAPSDRSVPANKQKYVPTNGTYPKGFLAGTAHAGVKPSNTKYDDIAMVVSEEPCPASAVFTRNIFQAAPVILSARLLSKKSRMRGVIVNSGCANAVTGKIGLEHAETMAKEADRCFDNGVPSSQEDAHPQTLVMSTGVIGQRLPIDRITEAIPKAYQSLGASHDHWLNAARAICTTDTFPKLLSRTFTLPSHPQIEYSVAGMTKGAGMIHPNMGTLLAVICTDAKISSTAIDIILKRAVSKSFNSISIDGETSTNDTVALFANGAATPESAAAVDVPAVVIPDLKAEVRHSRAPARELSADALAFEDVLTGFTTDLAKLVVRDGEGATKFVAIRVESDLGTMTAKRVAESIARSALVKTALYGKDANWGRILCAIGNAPGVMLDARRLTQQGVHSLQRFQVIPERTSVSFVPADGSEELRLLVRGEPMEVDEHRAKQILEQEDLEILVKLDDGPMPPGMTQMLEQRQLNGKATKERRRHTSVVWTCDLSHEYVTINGDYRT